MKRWGSLWHITWNTSLENSSMIEIYRVVFMWSKHAISVNFLSSICLLSIFVALYTLIIFYFAFYKNKNEYKYLYTAATTTIIDVCFQFSGFFPTSELELSCELLYHLFNKGLKWTDPFVCFTFYFPLSRPAFEHLR